MWLRPRPAAVIAAFEPTAAGIFTVEVTLTFAAGPDPFALDLDDAPALVVSFRGRDLLRRTEEIPAGQPIRIESVEGLVAGANEFYVAATPTAQDAAVARAIRVRILRDGATVAEQSLWSAPGESVNGIVVVDVDTHLVAPSEVEPSEP
jgi:hypothetical protein